MGPLKFIILFLSACCLYSSPCFAQSFPQDNTKCKPIDARNLTVPADFKVISGSGPLHPDTLLNAEKAEQIVWSLPEVKKMAEQIRQAGARPFTRVEAAPDEPSERTFSIYFGEDHRTHTVRVETFIVDRKTGAVSVYDLVSDTKLSLEEWKKKR
jgi:hypothetical protein